MNIKDIKTLIDQPNKLLANYHARIIIEEAPETLLKFYEENKYKINEKVVVVRSEEDEGLAANFRNSEPKVLFVFSADYLVIPRYFSGVSHKVVFSKALLKRVSKLPLSQKCDSRILQFMDSCIDLEGCTPEQRLSARFAFVHSLTNSTLNLDDYIVVGRVCDYEDHIKIVHASSNDEAKQKFETYVRDIESAVGGDFYINFCETVNSLKAHS